MQTRSVSSRGMAVTVSSPLTQPSDGLPSWSTRHRWPVSKLARSGGGLVVLVAALLSLGTRAGIAAGASELDPRAKAEIDALLAEKASWTAAESKMDSQLIHANKQRHGKAFAPGASKV